MKPQRTFLLPFFFCFIFLNSFVGNLKGEFFGSVPTGLLALEKKHPYYLYVPPDYSSEKAWAFLVLLGQSGKDPKQVIEPWVEWAKQNHFLILVPGLSFREGTVPDLADKWILKIKEEVGERYRVDRSQILLTGIGSGAHYAAYLGVNYPHEFSAAALVRGSWAGPFEKLIRPKSSSRRQISFYLALDPDSKEYPRMEQWALRLEKNGYRIKLDPLKLNEEFSGLQQRIAQWFHQDTDARTILAKRPRLKTKEKIDGFIKDFLEV